MTPGVKPAFDLGVARVGVSGCSFFGMAVEIGFSFFAATTTQERNMSLYR